MRVRIPALRKEGFEVVADLLEEIARSGRSKTLGRWVKEARLGLRELANTPSSETERAESGLLAAVQLLAELAGVDETENTPQRTRTSDDQLSAMQFTETAQ
ncbi:MAG: hypothetical protein H6832_02930 [Planctomycetes bacterium]|nr:hypothetical protein [Planctomycetota bacterium]MCB9917336.1 hypothetical protein [Planctomycetota bacterium]